MVIHPAIIHDSKGAVPVIKRLIGRFSDLKKRPADGGYRGPLAEFVKELGWDFEVVLRPQKSALKFMTLPLRWIVERTFSWIENYRRMTIDYERCSESAEAMLHLSFCQILLKKTPPINSKQLLKGDKYFDAVAFRFPFCFDGEDGLLFCPAKVSE